MLNLNDREWKAFAIKDIFITEQKKSVQVPTGAYVHKSRLNDGNTPRITVTSFNNGVDGYYASTDKNYRVFENFISVSFLGTIFYHPYKASIDMKVHCLQLIDKDLNAYISKFLITEIKQSISNASYGDQLSSTDLSNKMLLLPITDNGEPDYAFMEQYIKEREEKLKQKYFDFIGENYKVGGVIPRLEEKEWKGFFIRDIFSLESTSSGIDGNRLSNGQGNIPYLTRTDLNNGYKSFVEAQSEKYRRDSGNCITIGLDTQTAFYQPHSFYTGQNIQVLKNDKLNKYNAEFFIPLLHNAMTSLNWGGNGATLGRLKKKKIVVPIAADETPDYDFMEQYIKAVMFEKYKRYLEYQR